MPEPSPRDTSQLLNPETDTPLEVTRTHFTGRQAFILYALLRYQERYGDINGIGGMIRRGLGWVATQRTTTGAEAGLYKGGRAPDQITWHSTEHNTNLWHVFELASRVLGEKGYRDQADALAQAIMDRLWNAGEQPFNRGSGGTSGSRALSGSRTPRSPQACGMRRASAPREPPPPREWMAARPTLRGMIRLRRPPQPAR